MTDHPLEELTTAPSACELCSMDVYQAVISRRAVRAFLGTTVPRAALERVLTAAARAPSGGNLQPWHSYVLTGAPLELLKKQASARAAVGDPGDEREYQMYPPHLRPLYRNRQASAGEQRYSALGIAREDRVGRKAAVAANWNCFGASTALFCYVDRDMGLPQWADVGIYLQTVMLLLRAEGLHSCPQMAWSVYRTTVAAIVRPPSHLMLFCGLSIGFENAAAPAVRIRRAPLDETTTFIDER
jgi:nitroreductase